MNDLFLQHYILSKELEISVRKTEYFTFHLGRCIKFEDKIRLSIFIASQIAYAMFILIELKRIINIFTSLKKGSERDKKVLNIYENLSRFPVKIVTNENSNMK